MSCASVEFWESAFSGRSVARLWDLAVCKQYIKRSGRLIKSTICFHCSKAGAYVVLSQTSSRKRLCRKMERADIVRKQLFLMAFCSPFMCTTRAHHRSKLAAVLQRIRRKGEKLICIDFYITAIWICTQLHVINSGIFIFIAMERV